MAEKILSTAKVVDGILILSLPDALSPVVWQMELGQSKSSALEVRQNDSTHFVLTLKTPRQDILEIATYSDRNLAVKALMAASAALEKAHGQLKQAAYLDKPANYPLPVITKTSSGTWTFIKRTLLTLAIVFAVFVTLGITFLIITSSMGRTSAPLHSGTENTPMSADEFLEGR